MLGFCNTNGGNSNEDENDGGPGREAEEEKKEEEVVSPENKAIINACLVGLFTGIGVVLFNIAVLCHLSYKLLATFTINQYILLHLLHSSDSSTINTILLLEARPPQNSSLVFL